MPTGESAEGRELGTLALSCVREADPMHVLRAAHVWNALNRVRLDVPFFVVHDLVVLSVAAPESVVIGVRPVVETLSLTKRQREAIDVYARVIREVSGSEVLERARTWRLGDDLLAVFLLRALSPLAAALGGSPLDGGSVHLPLDPGIYEGLEPTLGRLFSASPQRRALAMLELVADKWLRLVTAIEQVDFDTLRLLGMFGAEAGAASSLGMTDLLQVLESPEANDVVNFSLDLLPSVLETKRAGGQQVYAAGGYAGVARAGTLDSLVLSELAFGPDVFAQRFAEREVFYFARPKADDEVRRVHIVVVDASASMRGRRSVFARGLALTLVKKLLLRGDDVDLRFFDSRLYEVQRARPSRGESGGLSVPYVLSFRGERGRNYSKVFGLLAHEVERRARRDGRPIFLYLLTHAQCHVPLDTIDRLARVATLYGIFMLPSTGDLELDYLDRLDSVQIVDETSLQRGEARKQRALDILDDAARARGSSRPRGARA